MLGINGPGKIDRIANRRKCCLKLRLNGTLRVGRGDEWITRLMMRWMMK